MNAIQFNALAIIFIMGILPFSIAFVTNAGSSSETEYEDSILSSYLNQNVQSGQAGVGSYAAKWINNGGKNHTTHYLAIDSTPHYANRTFIEDGKCPAAIQPPAYYPKWDEGNCLTVIDTIPATGILPMTSKYMPQSHYTASLVSAPYVGASGNGPFTFLLHSAYFNNIQQGEALDKIKFDLVYTPVDYNCGSSVFQNLTFEADITFHTPNGSKSFTDFKFEQNTKYEFEQYDPVHGYTSVCNVGLILEFDFLGFETLTIDELVRDDWENTSIELNIDDFQRADDNLPFTTEALPFAGVNSFSIGVQHQAVDPVQAGFIIRSLTLILSFATFALAIASTPYWDPFRNAFKGALD